MKRGAGEKINSKRRESDGRQPKWQATWDNEVNQEKIAI